MDTLDTIRPQRKRRVFDLAEEAGIDVDDWIASSSSPTKFKANPKYCYNWSLLTPGRVLLLNLWFDSMHPDADGTIVCAENYRQDAADLRAAGGKSMWVKRGLAFDRELQEAVRDVLPVRVIVNHGTRRNRGDAAAAPSRVDFRDLDPEPWHVRHYDPASGAFVLARGADGPALVDQFDQLAPFEGGSDDPARRPASGMVFARDPAVRRAALARSGGRCEHCGVEGFVTVSGARYLETHHIVPLAAGGPDTLANVIALCPDDHRRAHFAQDRDAIGLEMTARIAGP